MPLTKKSASSGKNDGVALTSVVAMLPLGPAGEHQAALKIALRSPLCGGGVGFEPFGGHWVHAFVRGRSAEFAVGVAGEVGLLSATHAGTGTKTACACNSDSSGKDI